MFSPCHCKSKIPRTSNFPPICRLSTSSSRRKVSENRLNTWDSVQVESGKFQMLSIRKVFSLPSQRQNTWATEDFHRNAHLNNFELKQSFRNSVEYLWRNRIFAGTVYWLKVGYFKFCRCANFSPVIAKVKYLRTWNFPPICPPSTTSRWSKVFENPLINFGDIGFLLGQCTGWKWEISNGVHAQSFRLVIAKV